MSVTRADNTQVLTAQLDGNVDVAIRLMLEDIHREANPITPYREGGLRTMVTKTMVAPRHGRIQWSAPYAEYQERGYTTGPVTHYTTPGTHAHFAEESVKKVIGRAGNYFKQAGVIR